MIVNVADLINPKSKLTWREENSLKRHNIPVGTLVEIESGARLFVVSLDRDCDMTPLYCLCADRNDTTRQRDGFANRKWYSGYPEESLRVIR